GRQFHRRGDLGFLGHVAADVADAVPEPLLQHLALLVLDVGGDHLGSLRQEEFERAQADARNPAGDHRHLAVQPARHHPPPDRLSAISTRVFRRREAAGASADRSSRETAPAPPSGLARTYAGPSMAAAEEDAHGDAANGPDRYGL